VVNVEQRDECRNNILALLRNIGRPATLDELITVYQISHRVSSPRSIRERVSEFVSRFESAGLIHAEYDSRGILIQCRARENQS